MLQPLQGKTYSNACSYKGCKKREAMPLMCAGCRQNFCLRHRHEDDHECKPVKAGTSAARAAEVLPPLTHTHAPPLCIEHCIRTLPAAVADAHRRHLGRLGRQGRKRHGLGRAVVGRAMLLLPPRGLRAPYRRGGSKPI